jgi:hypothetical protein
LQNTLRRHTPCRKKTLLKVLLTKYDL